MREAITLSAVPIYQEIARRIGHGRMRDWVKWSRYGNEEIGTAVDRFWLDGPLQITASEQTLFMGRLGCDGYTFRLAPTPLLPRPSEPGSGFFSAHASERSRAIVKRMVL